MAILGLPSHLSAQPADTTSKRRPADPKADPGARPAPGAAAKKAPEARPDPATRPKAAPAKPTSGDALSMRTAPAPKKGITLTLQQAIAMARRGNLQLKASKVSIRSAKVARKLGWAMLGPHFSLSADFAFLGGDSSFDAMGSGTPFDPVAIGTAACLNSSNPVACGTWMATEPAAEYTGLLIGESLGAAMSGFGAIGDIFNADHFKLQLGFAWQVLDWGNLINVRRFKLTHRLTKVSHKNTTQDVVTNVKVMFYAILAAQEAARIVKETSKATKEHLRQAKALKIGGLGTKVDILRWQAKIADDEQKILETEQQVASAKMRLNNLLGRPLRSPIEVVAPPEVTAKDLPRPKAVSAPLRSHPQLRLTRLNLKLKKVDVQSSKSAFLPKVTLSGGYSLQHYLPYEDSVSGSGWLKTWAVMLNVTVPIFDSMTKIYNVQLKRLAVTKARIEARNVRRLLREQVLQADLSVTKSYRSIEVAKKQVKLAEEAHKSAENLYKAGSAKTTDVLDAQNGMRLARFNLLSARFGYLTALAQRDRAVGAVR